MGGENWQRNGRVDDVTCLYGLAERRVDIHRRRDNRGRFKEFCFLFEKKSNTRKDNLIRTPFLSFLFKLLNTFKIVIQKYNKQNFANMQMNWKINLFFLNDVIHGIDRHATLCQVLCAR